jgi:hypothetical protein
MSEKPMITNHGIIQHRAGQHSTMHGGSHIFDRPELGRSLRPTPLPSFTSIEENHARPGQVVHYTTLHYTTLHCTMLCFTLHYLHCIVLMRCLTLLYQTVTSYSSEKAATAGQG